MKVILNSIAALHLCSMLNGHAQGTFNTKRYYCGDSMTTLNWVNSMVAGDSNLYLSLAVSDNSGQNFALVKANFNGIAEKTLRFHDSLASMPTYPTNTLILDRNGDLLVASSKGYHHTYTSDAFVVKLNKNLDTLWTRVYDLPATAAGYPQDTILLDFATAIKQTPDGGYIVTGSYRRIPQGTIDDRAFLLKIDTDGNVQWWRAYPNVINGSYAIEVAPDSGYFITGIISPMKLSIIKLSKHGDWEWSTQVNHTSKPAYPMGITLIDSTYIIVTSAVWISAVDRLRNLVISKVDVNTRQLVFERQYYLYRSYINPELHSTLSLRILANKDILLCSTFCVRNPENNVVSHKGVLFRLNSDGDSLWSRYYGYGGWRDDCQFNDVLLTDDGGFLAAGWHFPWDGSYNAGAWLVKTDSLGYAPGSTPTGLEKPPALVSSFNIYPNPATGHTWIALDDTGQAASLNLLDLSGRIVSSHSLPRHEKEYQLDTSKLKSGIYLLSLIYESGQVVTTKLVVR